MLALWKSARGEYLQILLVLPIQPTRSTRGLRDSLLEVDSDIDVVANIDTGRKDLQAP